MEALRYPREDIETVVTLVELHLRFHTYRLGWTDRAVRRYVRDAGPLLDRLNELTRCDCTTRNAAKAKALGRRMDELEARIAELAQRESLEAIRPELDGNEVMARLGLAPGPAVGQALSFLLELRLDEGPLGPEEAGRRLDEWWAARAGPGRPRRGPPGHPTARRPGNRACQDEPPTRRWPPVLQPTGGGRRRRACSSPPVSPSARVVRARPRRRRPPRPPPIAANATLPDITRAVRAYQSAQGLAPSSYVLTGVSVSTVDSTWAKFDVGPSAGDRASFQGGYGFVHLA